MSNGRGYTQIAASESMGSDEATPLASNALYLRTTSMLSKGRRSTWAVGGAVVIVGGLALAFFVREMQPGLTPASSIQIDEDPSHPSILYRPVCEYYTSALRVNHEDSPPPFLIQTSMNEPSEQWAEKPCFPATVTSTEAHLNAYAAPDAVFRVNFSAPAFANREHSILGFGGAFTEAAALNFGRLSEEGKEAAIELLFGRSGLGYSLGRVHINSCDFSVKSYSFDETEDDFELKDFDMTVHHDTESGMVEMALRATSVFRDAWVSPEGEGGFKMYASPWSPPPWMKSPTWEDEPGAVHAKRMTYSANNTCLREGVGKDSRYARAWALYFSKFLTAYQNLGLPIWAVTVQNEPEFAAPWEACSYTSKTQRDFVANHLGPRLKEEHPDVKLFIFDHNKDHINTWGDTILNSSSAAQYVDGTAYHWYTGGMDRLLDGATGAANMHRFMEKLEQLGVRQNHIVLGSEACHCPTTGYSGGDIEIYWSRAERYAHSILADLAAGSHGWAEWNFILDGIGGPNHLGNLCETTILAVPHRAKGVDAQFPPLPGFEKSKPFGDVIIGDGRTREELNALGFPAKYLDVGIAVQPLYFYMGHISRHVRPGSVGVMGLVTQAPGGKRIFRPEGQVVAGGGMNDLARDGIELTVWPCEGSTRQQFQWDVESRQIQVFGHDWLGHPTKSCVETTVDKDFMDLRLKACTGDSGVFDFIYVPEAGSDVFKVILKNPPHSSKDQCLAILKLKNEGGAYGPRGGAQVTLGSCDEQSSMWRINQSTGEVVSMYFGNDEDDVENEVCLTTGWPFLQMGAFLTPNGDASKTVVVLNEARDSANYALQDGDQIVLTGTIPPRSIQTILID